MSCLVQCGRSGAWSISHGSFNRVPVPFIVVNVVTFFSVVKRHSLRSRIVPSFFIQDQPIFAWTNEVGNHLISCSVPFGVARHHPLLLLRHRTTTLQWSPSRHFVGLGFLFTPLHLPCCSFHNLVSQLVCLGCSSSMIFSVHSAHKFSCSEMCAVVDTGLLHWWHRPWW